MTSVISRICVAAGVVSSLAGCANTYRVAANDPVARVSFDFSSDSTGSMTAGSFKVWAYANLACAPSPYGALVGHGQKDGSGTKLGPVNVRADLPFVFAPEYTEERPGQNRSCTFTASFAPAAGKAYKIDFAVVNESGRCGVRIADEQGVKVPFTTPEVSCIESFGGRNPNGVGGTVANRVRTGGY